MLDDIIMILFTDSTKQATESHQKHFFPKSRIIQITCTKNICRILHGKEKMLIQKGHYVRIITLKKKSRNYLSVILSIDNDEADIGKPKKPVHQ